MIIIWFILNLVICQDTTTMPVPYDYGDDYVYEESGVIEFYEDSGPIDFYQNEPHYSYHGGNTSPSHRNPLTNLEAQLLEDGRVQLSWDYDVTHDSYGFESQQLIGNGENTTDWITISGVTIGYDDETNFSKVFAVFLPAQENTIYRVKVFQVDTDQPEADISFQTIDIQSKTTMVTYQPGTIYTGGSGFVGQVLLVNDFSDPSYMRTDGANDLVGYVTAIMVSFPSECYGINMDADVDKDYIFMDENIPQPHRIFIFPQTHFSNQFSGIMKAFHFYISNMDSCITDPSMEVTVRTANEYLERITDIIDSTSSPSNITLDSVWPTDGIYPPVNYTELQFIWFPQLVKSGQTGLPIALGPPRISFLTGQCDVLVNIDNKVSTTGWGFKTDYDSRLHMTDLYSAPGVSNLGNKFLFQALEWNTHLGVAYRYNTDSKNCNQISAAGTVTYLQISEMHNITNILDLEG